MNSQSLENRKGQVLDSAKTSHGLNPKWVALISDELYPMPRQKLQAATIMQQAGLNSDHYLIRDYSDTNDIAFAKDDLVDLAEGNVFRVECDCKGGSLKGIKGKPKVVFAVDDTWEITLANKQTEESLKGLFGLPASTKLCRDYESPQDEPIRSGETIQFEQGPVFKVCKEVCDDSKEIKIVVNGREKTVVQKSLSYAQVVELAFGAIDPDKLYTVMYSNGPASKPKGKMVEGDVVKIVCGEIFNVTFTTKS